MLGQQGIGLLPAPSAPLGAPEALLVPGGVIDGKYLLEDKLDEGGMGIVFRARHLFLRKTVALKLLRARVSEAMARRFAREARLASQLDDPHCVAIYDCGQDPKTGLFYLA